MPKLIDLTGKVFDKLTVLEKAPSRARHVYWKCQCECGNIVEVSAESLKRNIPHNCGCVKLQLQKEKKQAKEDKGYTPEKGSEKMVHLSIVQGRRFSSTTGKELSKPFVQKFTYAEWQLFKKNFKGLGYSIMAVLHDPYNEAKDYVVKEQE